MTLKASLIIKIVDLLSVNSLIVSALIKMENPPQRMTVQNVCYTALCFQSQYVYLNKFLHKQTTRETECWDDFIERQILELLCRQWIMERLPGHCDSSRRWFYQDMRTFSHSQLEVIHSNKTHLDGIPEAKKKELSYSVTNLISVEWPPKKCHITHHINSDLDARILQLREWVGCDCRYWIDTLKSLCCIQVLCEINFHIALLDLELCSL